MEKTGESRSAVKEEYKWNLTGMYENLEAFDEDFQKLKDLYPTLATFKGHIMDTSTSLYDCLKRYFEVDTIINQLMVYIHGSLDVDLTDSKIAEKEAEVLNVIDDVNEVATFIIPEILKSDLETVEKYIEENKGLEEYRVYLKRLFRQKNHVLDDETEKLLANFGSINGLFKTSSGFIRDVEMKYGAIRLEDGEEIELTASNCEKYIVHKNREVRKQAYEKRCEAFENSIRSLASNYAGHIRYDELEAKLRHYKDAKESDFEDLNMDSKVYDALITSANKNKDIYQKYLRFVQNVLGVEKLEPYDLSAPLVEASDKEYTYEEAKEMLLDIFQIYGKEYTKVLEEIFDNRWVDVMPSTGKRTGWYAWGSPTTHPIVFGNFHGKFNDVSALAHELGHAVNFYKVFKKQPVQYADNTLFDAEVASLTNEIVFSKVMLQKTEDKNEKLQILDNLISLFVGNFFGGEKGAEFEDAAHKLVKEGSPITASTLSLEWKKITDKFNGDIVENQYHNNWARIPHFYTSFYYYKYATGITAACYISKKILEKDEEAIQNYLSYLEIGTSMDPLDTLKIAGVDMTEERVFEEAIKVFDSWLDEFMEIYSH